MTGRKLVRIKLNVPATKTFYAAVQALKQAGARFDPTTKSWAISYDPADLHPNAIKSHGEYGAAVSGNGASGWAYVQYMTFSQSETMDHLSLKESTQ